MFRKGVKNVFSAKMLKKVLIASNNRGSLKTLTMVLGVNYEVISVSLREPEFRAALTGDIQMVVLDVGMKDIAENTTPKLLEATNNRQRVVMLFESEVLEEQSLSFGSSFKHLVKPVHLHELKQALEGGMVVSRQQLNA